MSEAQRRIHIGLSSDERRFHLNIVKMLCCLLSEYTIRFDNDQSNKSADFDMPTAKVREFVVVSSALVLTDSCLHHSRKEKRRKK